MKFNKKGFSLAEMLIVFLLVSMMLTAFAPLMTKRAKKSSDPNCVGGVKKMEAIFPYAGDFTFKAPEGIVGDAKVTLVGGGGAGADATDCSAVGNGGEAGEYIEDTVSLLASTSYNITVGSGGKNGGNGTDSSINATCSKLGETCLASLGEAGNGEYSNGNGGTLSNECADITDESCMDYGDNPAAAAALAGCTNDLSCINGKSGLSYQVNSLSNKGFFAGLGGGGGGYYQEGTPSNCLPDGCCKGKGGSGGDGFVKIEYSIRCE